MRISMDIIECSVWSNGSSGWGLTILGGSDVRYRYFNRKLSPVKVELADIFYEFNIDKDSFWNKCPHIIGRPIKDWVKLHGLQTGDKVKMEIIEPYKSFRISIDK